MRADLIFVGTELLLGEILNSNAQYLSQRLGTHGVDVYFQTTVGDNLERLEQVLRQGLERSDLVITTGGLGPTVDDLTRDAVARVAARPLREDPSLVKELEEFFRYRGLEMTANNRRQAQLPEGARALPNPNGTAPGILLDLGDRTIICLPGPPREMIPMFEDQVAPLLKAHPAHDRRSLYSRILKVAGMAEATADHLLADLLAGPADPTIAPYARRGEIHLRLATKAADPVEAAARLEAVEKVIRARLGHHLFGVDDETLEAVIGRELAARRLRLALAESCTGGLIGHRITNVPGSSAYFLAGITAYDNGAKERLLGVPAATLARFGAVSAETAAAMAAGVRHTCGADIGLAVTGIAGPGGGSAEKPVGTVYLAAVGWGDPVTRRLGLQGSRDDIKERSATLALTLLREYLLGTVTGTVTG